jgi:citrate lyase subunit beta/citryl-CoA lyase
MRSKLFVPASRPELFVKALQSTADAVAFDLEDSVLGAQKADARTRLREFVQQEIATDKVIVVRVNGMRTEFFSEDISAMAWPGIALVNLPKTEDAVEVQELAKLLSSLERERGISQPIAILPTIESPRGLRLAHAIAAADPRVAGLQLGSIDLLLPLGITIQNQAAAQNVRLQLRLAAGEAELPCFDGAFSDIEDIHGFTEDARVARSLGFSGKSCIHPRQIATANQMFSPTAEEVAGAQRILDTARDALARGQGTFALDGRMIDQPIIRQAMETIRLAASAQTDERPR